jgi:type IV fimbrial biogenesis protein FimT
VLAKMTNVPTRRRLSGVTLVELLVGLVILGLLMSLAAPSMRSFISKHRVAAINSELVADLYLARTESIQRNAKVQVIFNTDKSVNPNSYCYTIHAGIPGLGSQCDCRRGSGKACLDKAGNAIFGVTELKTVTVAGADGVKLTAVAVGGTLNNAIQYEAPRGIPQQGASITVSVSSTVSNGGYLKTSSNMLGRQTVCTPDGSIAGVAPC